MTPIPRVRVPSSELLGLLGLAALLAGAVLLARGLSADLASHTQAHHTLVALLPPRAAQTVAQLEAQEETNPWHRVIVGGQALLIGGLALLYLGERLKTHRLQAALQRLAGSRAASAPDQAPATRAAPGARDGPMLQPREHPAA